MVEGTFARVFKSELQPVEVASAVQHEMDERAAIVAQGRTLVPNDFVVEIAQTDAERLDVLAEDLGVELATLARDHAKEQGYSFVGPVRIRFEGIPDLTTGTFRIRSGVIRGHTVEAGEVRQPVSDLPRVASSQFPGRPRLVVSGSSPGTGVTAGSTYELQTPVTLLGRGTDCDLRLVDPGNLVTANGTVTSAGWVGGYGKMVEVDHGNGLATRYGHMSEIYVKVGQQVKLGQSLGKVGTTGRSTGPHLHYETRIDGEAVDPQRFLSAGSKLADVL